MVHKPEDEGLDDVAEVNERLKRALTAAAAEMLPDADPPRLYHYTNAPGLKGIIETGRIWATHARFLNDALELRHGGEVFDAALARAIKRNTSPVERHILETLRPRCDPFSANPELQVYVSCFCTEKDLLSQWRGYGADEGSYCLGFDFDPEVETHRTFLTKVVYDPQIQSTVADLTVEATLEFIRDAKLEEREDTYVIRFLNRVLSVLVARLGAFIVEFKHAAYSEENEWRLTAIRGPGANDLRFRASRFGLTPYVELDLLPPAENPRAKISEVVVGPSLHADLLAESARMYVGLRSSEAQVSKSEVPFRG